MLTTVTVREEYMSIDIYMCVSRTATSLTPWLSCRNQTSEEHKKHGFLCMQAASFTVTKSYSWVILIYGTDEAPS